MKKKTKILASVLSAAIMAASAVAPVSAGLSFSGKISYSTETSGSGYTYPVKIVESLEYTGIVVTMPEGEVPTAESLGIDCDITEYTTGVNVIGGGIGLKEDGSVKEGWSITDTVKKGENRYFLDVDELMSEDEAADLAKKLVIRGLANEAEVAYKRHFSQGTMCITGYDVHFGIKFNTNEGAADFSFEKYPELKELLGFTEITEFTRTNNDVTLLGDYSSSSYEVEESGDVHIMQAYNDIMALNDVMTEKYDEIESVSPVFLYLDSDNVSSASYSIQPAWGDATNDDKIDLNDAIEIAKYIMGSSDLDEDTVLLADINRDGKTDIYDVIEIAKTLLS